MMEFRVVFRLIFLYSLILNSVVALRVWKTKSSVLNAQSWEDNILPCYSDKLTFPEDLFGSLLLPYRWDTSGLILPKTGAIILKPDSVIELQTEGHPYSGTNFPLVRTNCNTTNVLAKFKTAKRRYWLDPDNWMGNAHADLSPAVPHVEAVPCMKTTAIIRDDGLFSFDMENIPELHVSYVSFNAMQRIPNDALETFFKTELGQMIFRSSASTRIKSASDGICSCHGEATDLYKRLVCDHRKPLCELPRCMNPIVPIGHCCAVCGVIFKFKVTSCLEDFAVKIRVKISKERREQKLTDQLAFWASYVLDNNVPHLQVILLDIMDYNELSTNFLKLIENDLRAMIPKDTHVNIITSGERISGGISEWLIVFSTFFAVIAFFFVMHSYYIPENSLVTLPPWMSLQRYRVFRSPFIFARFENNPVEVETQNVAVDIPYRNQPTIDPAEGRTSFDNPMFCDREETKETIPSGPLETAMDEVQLVEANLPSQD